MLLFISCEYTHSNDNEANPDFNLGRPASAEEIKAWDFDISPSGTGLPEGKGTVAEGRKVYETKCARCHGKNLEDGPYARLVAGKDSDEKAIGHYWPYATTLYDYTMRAMPYDNPGSLSPNEVYALCAFILYRNQLVDSTTVLNNVTLPRVHMPALSKYVNDDRKGGNEIK